MKRRALIAALAAAALGARAQNFQPPQDIAPLVAKITGGKAVAREGVEVQLPALAENGNSVPLRIRVASPMSAEDHVTAIHVFAERNPRPHVATFRLGPHSGRAEISTRIRLAGTQRVTVLAELSGGRFVDGVADVVVTSAACLDESTMGT
jgi:sulfur-oxidizing protein SoxY